MRIGVVTGSRADWSGLMPLARALRDDPAFELILYATGAHMLDGIGPDRAADSLYESVEDGFSPETLSYERQKGDRPHEVALAAGNIVDEFGLHFDDPPDLLIVYGDRFEQLAAAFAAALHGIPIAHIGGGDASYGSLDERWRHCLTKLAALHFVNTERAAARVRRLGEEGWRVHVVGELALDRIAGRVWEAIADHERPILVTFHPDTLSPERSVFEASALADALILTDRAVFVTAANADAGGRDINEFWHKVGAHLLNIRFVRSLGWERYSAIMRVAACMVGNSSSGLIEAPSFGLPVVNVGPRQDGRLKARNVIDVPCETAAILKGIDKALSPEFRASLVDLVNPYGDGHAVERIMAVLRELPPRDRLLRKEWAGAD